MRDATFNFPLNVPSDPGRHALPAGVRYADGPAKAPGYGIASSPEPPDPRIGPAGAVVGADEPPDDLGGDPAGTAAETPAAGVCHASASAAGTPLLAPLPAKPPKLSHAPLSSGASLDHISPLRAAALRPLRPLRRRLFFSPLRGGFLAPLAGRGPHPARIQHLLCRGHAANRSSNRAGPS